MSKYSNCVRFIVKEGKNKALVDLYQNSGFVYDGMECQFIIQTGEREYVGVGIWDSQEALVNNRSKLIQFLDTLRHLLEEISPELGVTDPRSGHIIWEEISN